MSELLRERAQYSKGKTPIIAKYLVDHKQLFNEIAGRGFLNLPGYAFDAENDIEMAAKFGLSELNYKILASGVRILVSDEGEAISDYDYADTINSEDGEISLSQLQCMNCWNAFDYNDFCASKIDVSDRICGQEQCHATDCDEAEHCDHGSMELAFQREYKADCKKEENDLKKISIGG